MRGLAGLRAKECAFQDALSLLSPEDREALRTRRRIALDPRKRITTRSSKPLERSCARPTCGTAGFQPR